MFRFADLDKDPAEVGKGTEMLCVEAGRLSPPLTLVVACCVASDKLLGLSESQAFHVCSRGLDWTDSMCFLHL